MNNINILLEKIRSKKHMTIGIVIVFVIVLFLMGQFGRDKSYENDMKGSHGKGSLADKASSGERSIKYWTCSMHPQIKLSKKGSCPICAMDLVPVYEGASEDDDSEVSLTLNKTARQLAEVETTRVQLKEVFNEVRLLGKVDYDETRLSYISAWAAGRIDRLFVDFTGTKVREGDHLIQLYSPELISAQEEYLQSIKALEDMAKSTLSVMRQTSEMTLKSSKEKLRLLGIDEKQIEEIKNTAVTQEHLTINSPVKGTVIHKNGFEGMYVKTGDKIYTIADLSKVWLYLEAYESDIQWLHYGQSVRVEAEAYPGETFPGKVAFIDPFVDEKTRTIKLRVNVDNPQEKLKPGMFVRSSIKSTLNDSGRVYEEELAGKFICPMHPEIIKDHQAPCDICEMDLVKTSEFGFSDQKVENKKSLVIPATAPLITGKRAIVYVENDSNKKGSYRYEGREVVLGPKAGNDYIVLSGLKEDERVVTKGNFKIDSALQIQAKPSMMNPAGFYSEKNNTLSQGVQTQSSIGMLKPAMKEYLKVSKYMAHDNPEKAREALVGFEQELKLLFEKNIVSDGSEGLGGYLHMILHQMKTIPEDIKEFRELFGYISSTLKVVFEEYEYKEDLTLYLSYCPMALSGQGAYWFQVSEKIANPYFGSRMFSCGEVKQEYGRTIMKMDPKGSQGHNH